MKFFCPSSLTLLAVTLLLLNQANADRCPRASWRGPGDYCIGGMIHWCNYPDAPANGLFNDCGGRGCQANLRGQDQCNPIGGIIGGGGGSIIGGGDTSPIDTYRFNGFEDLCIDITDGRLIAGQAAQMWHCDNRNKNQRFTQFSDGTIRVVADTSLCLDAYQGLSAGAPIQLWQCTGHDNQRWSLRLNGDGTIRPRSRPDLCFNIVDGRIQAGPRLPRLIAFTSMNTAFTRELERLVVAQVCTSFETVDSPAVDVLAELLSRQGDIRSSRAHVSG